MPTFEDLSWIGQEIKNNFERHVCIVITSDMYTIYALISHLYIHIVMDNIEWCGINTVSQFFVCSCLYVDVIHRLEGTAGLQLYEFLMHERIHGNAWKWYIYVWICLICYYRINYSWQVEMLNILCKCWDVGMLFSWMVPYPLSHGGGIKSSYKLHLPKSKARQIGKDMHLVVNVHASSSFMPGKDQKAARKPK